MRARRACRAPISGAACVAFCLAGSSGAFVVDDAGGGTFDLVTEGSDAPIAVELNHAALELPRSSPP